MRPGRAYACDGRRRPLLRTLLLSLLAGLLVTIPCATAAARAPYRGVQLHSLWWNRSDAEMDAELDLARAAGSTTVRVDVAWANIEEAGKGQYTASYVAKLDRFVAGAAARGMSVIATLWATPCWASSAPETLKQGCAAGWWARGVASYPPLDPSDYADVARWLTARYGTRLAALEVWNEPNLATRFWNAADPAGAYAALLRASYPAAKAGDPAVPVLAGSLAGTDHTFLAELYGNGMRGYYDGLAVHPYADPGFALLQAFRATQVAAGDSTPIWVTEFGWPTGADPVWHVSLLEQAAEIQAGFAALDALDWVVGATLYELRDGGTDAQNMEDNFGVVTTSFEHKPGYAALSSALGSTTSEPSPQEPVPVTGTTPLPSDQTGSIDKPPPRGRAVGWWRHG